MKQKLTQTEWIFGVTYYAIAIATAKHSAWSYSQAMEGNAPVIDWATFNPDFNGLWLLGELAVWFMWGLLAAFAIDVSLFALAKNIREAGKKNLVGLYIIYAMVAGFSAYFQIMYALMHSASFVPVDGIPDWLNSVFIWRFLIVPLSLPAISLGYTMAIKIDQKANEPPIGKLDIDTGEKLYTVDEAALLANKSTSWIRQRAAAGLFGHKQKQIGRRDRWMFSQEDVEKIKNG